MPTFGEVAGHRGDGGRFVERGDARGNPNGHPLGMSGARIAGTAALERV